MLYENLLTKYERVRKETYEKVMGVKLEGPTEAKLIILRAYVTFSFRNRGEDAPKNKKHFSELIEQASEIHRQYVQDLFEGQFPPGISEDPRLAPSPFKDRSAA